MFGTNGYLADIHSLEAGMEIVFIVGSKFSPVAYCHVVIEEIEKDEFGTVGRWFQIRHLNNDRVVEMNPHVLNGKIVEATPMNIERARRS